MSRNLCILHRCIHHSRYRCIESTGQSSLTPTVYDLLLGLHPTATLTDIRPHAMDRNRSSHSHLNKDARFLAQRFAPVRRSALEDRLTQMVQTLDPSASVIHCYAPYDLRLSDELASDFMIVDSKNPQGLSPGSTPSDIYSPTAIAEALQRQTQSDVTCSTAANGEGIIWPATLHFHTSSYSSTLTLPNPVVSQIASYTAGATRLRRECLRETLILLALWNHSHAIKEFNVTALSLMLVQLVQHLAEQPSRKDPGAQGGRIDASNVVEALPPKVVGEVESPPARDQSPSIYLQERYKDPNGQLSTRAIKRSTGWKSWGAVSSPPDISRARPGQLLLLFLRHYANIERIANRDVIGIPSKKREKFVSTHRHLRQDTLIIADPFVISHNHAASVTQRALRSFSEQCRNSLTKLERSEPLISIFGQLPSLGFDPSSTQTQIPLNPSSSLTDLWRQTRLQSTQASQARHVTNRQGLIQRVNHTIQAEFGRKYRVEVFGSSRYQVDNPSSDVDLVIVDPDRTTGFEAGSIGLPRVYNVRLVANALRRAGFQKVFAIPSATVPIVKFHDPSTGLDCDVNVNDQLGVINSELLRAYCDISPILRPMIKAIKRWAKPLGLNNPSGQGGGGMTFNSYTLTVMTVAFLQSLGLLPNLQDGLPPLSDGRNSGVFWVRMRNDQRVPCDIRFRQVEGLSIPTEYTVEELLSRWLNFWGNEFQFAHSMVDIKSGGIRPRPPFSPTALLRKQRREKGKAAKASEAPEEVDSADLVPEMGNMQLDEEGVAVVDAHVGTIDTEGGDAGTESIRATTPEDVSIFSDDSPFCVVDPFIRTKNVAGNIQKNNLRRFISECRRALCMLALHGQIDDIAPESGADSDFDGHINREKQKRRNEGRRQRNGPPGRRGERADPRQGDRSTRARGQDGPSTTADRSNAPAPSSSQRGSRPPRGGVEPQRAT